MKELTRVLRGKADCWSIEKRFVRKDGRTEVDPVDQAADVHAVIEAIGGPVDLFGTSGGAITG